MKTKVIAPKDRYGMRREEAAEYVGVSPFLFDEMVEDGRMPKPKCVNSRRVWSRREIEAAFDRLPVKGEAALGRNNSSPWRAAQV